MLIITGLAGKIKYDNNTVNRIKHYNENSNFEGLLSFVVIHHGIDMLSITKKLDNEIKKEKVNKEQLENHLVDLNFRFKNLVKEENINVEEKMELENKLEEIGLIKEFKTELNSKNSVLNDELKDTIINLKFIEIINKYGTEKLKLHKEIKQLELKIDKSSIESKNFQIKEEEFSILEEKIKIVNTLKNSFNMEANKKLEDRTNEFKKLEKELKNENLNIKNQQKALLKVFIQEIEMLKNNYKKELNKDKKEKLKKEYVKEYNEKIQEFLADFKSLQKSGETNKKENQNKLKNILTNKFIFEMKIKLKELKNSFDNDTKTKEKLKGKINDIKNEEDEFKKLKDNLKKEIHNIKEQQKEKLNLFIQDKNNLENKYKNDLSKIKKEEYDLKKILEGTISVGKKKLEENLIQIKIKKEELKNKLNEKVGAKEKIYKIQWNYLKNNEDDIEKIIASKKIFFELKNKLIEELEEIKKGEFMKNKIEENELNIIEETTLKRKLDDKEINIKSIKENKNKLSVEKSQIEKKLQIFGIIDDDRHGLKSFFTYTKLNDTSCSKDTEKEYEMDVKLGNLEYEYNVIFKNKDMLIHLIEWEVFCKEIQNFRELMDNIYSKNAIKERNDFEIVDEWIYGRSQNSIEKRIVKLKDTKVIDRFFIEYKNGKTCDPEHAQALISDKNEAIAERLYYILNSAENTDDYALYAIFLARPKNELNDIVEKYDKIAHNMEKEKTLFEKLKLSNNIVSDFKNPKLIKHLEEHMAKEKLYKEIWHIFINRVHPNHLEDSKKVI
uniref:Uncharacterized protein n=1 Tax=Meloidogyne hapla TaxID=6305 RepID=A0A1I8BUM2_MELHA